MTNRISVRYLVIILIFLLGAAAQSCTSRKYFAGTYKIIESRALPPDTYLVLKENGEGVWRVDGNEISFTWFARRREIRIYTRSGGVLVARARHKRLKIALPGGREMIFKKIVTL